jgi:hypothetical protein
MYLPGETQVWEHNLKHLRRFQPQLAVRLQRRRALMEEESRVPSVKETAQGLWIRGFGDGDVPFFQKAESFFPEELGRKNVVIAHGIGFPPYLFRLLRRLDRNALAVVVVEPNEELLVHTLSTTSVYAALPSACRISFFTGENRTLSTEALDVNIRPLGIFMVNEACTAVHAGEGEAFRKEFDAAIKEFWETVRLYVEFLGNTAEDTLLGIRNMCLMSPWIVNSPRLRDFIGPYEGRPFVSVASGPSLEKNVHLLKDYADSCVIVAADSAVKKLLKIGIRPHIVTSMERPQEMYARNFSPLVENHRDECRNILLVAQSVCPQQVIGCWPGPVVVVGKAELALDQWIVNELFGGDLIPSGASVSHMAVSLAEIFKASAVALIGQDLAYGDDGASHAADTVSEADLAVERARSKEARLTVPGIHGGMVRTEISWFKFLKMFESMIPGMKVPLYDCTEGGALIQGSIVTPFREFLDKFAASMAPFSPDALPAALARRLIAGKDKRQQAKRLQMMIDSALSEVAHSEATLAEIESWRDRAVAAALAPDARRARAAEVSVLLDRLHDRNRSLAFIGQSYTHLSGVVFGETRRLDSVASVEKWHNTVEDILQGHRSILAFLRRWFRYTYPAMEWLLRGLDAGNDDPVYSTRELENTEALELTEKVLRRFAEDDLDDREMAIAVVALNNLLARSDPILHHWSPGILRQLALFCREQGMAKYACVLADAARERLETDETELPVEEIVGFLKDYAMVLASPDLTFTPPYEKAYQVARNLLRYEHVVSPAEVETLLGDIREKWRATLSNVFTSRLYDEKTAELERLLLKAQIDLLEGRLPDTFRAVWRLVVRSREREEGRGRACFEWLLLHLERCHGAEDKEISGAVAEIVDALSQQADLLSFFGMEISPWLMGELTKRGVKFSV